MSNSNQSILVQIFHFSKDTLMRKLSTLFITIALLSTATFAHRMLLMVEDNDDGTIYIEAGLSTGNVPAGARIILKDKSSGRPLWQGKVPSNGRLNVKQPTKAYTVTLDAGAGHAVTKEGPLNSAPVSQKVTPISYSNEPDSTDGKGDSATAAEQKPADTLAP